MNFVDQHSFTLMMNKTPKILFHYVTFMKIMERSSHIIFMKTIKTKQKWTPLPKKMHYLKVCCVKMCKVNLNPKSENENLFLLLFTFKYISRISMWVFVKCVLFIFVMWYCNYTYIIFILQTCQKVKEGTKKIVGSGASVGICIFHLCNYIYLTLIPFKYPRLIWIRPYTSLNT
jgi:hypothetical protein